MGSTNEVNLDFENKNIFSVESINKKEYLSDNFDIEDKKELLLNKLNTSLFLSSFPNSVKYIGYYEDKENINIVTEKCDMNLLEYLNMKGKLDIEEIKSLFIQLNNIFHIMLDNNIIHKIIKLENIFLKLKNIENKKDKNDKVSYYDINDYIIKLSDYGNDIIINNKNSNLDKFMTVAPEIINEGNYDNKVDLYSIGIVMYQLYFNCHPFGQNFNEINDKIDNEENEFKLSGNDIFDNLLQSLLAFNPEDRISWEQYFKHQFFKSNNISYSINKDEEFLNLQYIIRGEEDEILTKRSKKVSDDNEKLLNEFNLKFKNKIKVKLEDKKLNFYKKNIGNKGFELLSKIKFKQIESLHLNYNKINNIKDISNMKLSQLIKLDLSHNEIDNINSFENCSFSQLIELRLSYNKIKNINILGNCNLSKLKLLYLGHNQINNIDILDKCNFKVLNELYLSNNQINNIKILAKCNLNKLYKLGLSENNINNIEVLAECDFRELKKLYLYGNQIVNINILSKCNFSKINELYLYDNKINNIDVFEYCNFTQLKELSLYNNQIYNTKLINKLRENNITVYY